jgi:AcrR family transcriptional regulator
MIAKARVASQLSETMDLMAARAERSASLPIAGARIERADAARNRERILGAARRLISRNGATAVTLDEVAAEAGVGRATLFRRFPDRAALLLALLDEHERGLQDRILSGDPPLGPGAAASARLHAFAEALLDLTTQHRDLLLGSETTAPLARMRTGAYAFWHRHLTVLIEQLRPGDDATVLADLILGLYDAELQSHLAEQGAAGTVRSLLLDSVRRLSGARGRWT